MPAPSPTRLVALSDDRASVEAITGACATLRDDGELPHEIRDAWRLLVGGEAWQAGEGDTWAIIRAEAPDSQFDRLGSALAAGVPLPDRLVALALTGARFHGQHGRPWQALRGNLHVCFVHRVDVAAAASQVGLTLWPAVATARAIERASEGRLAPRTKWVNDLLLADRKVAGVLTRTGVQRDRVRHALLGIGVNVARRPDLAVDAGSVPPTALALHDPTFAEPFAWTRLVRPLIDALAEGRAAVEAGDGAEILAQYRHRAGFLGRTVDLWPTQPAATGPRRVRIAALTDDLELVLSDGEVIRDGRITPVLDPAVP